MQKTSKGLLVLAGLSAGLGLYAIWPTANAPSFALRLNTGDRLVYDLHYTSRGQGKLDIGLANGPDHLKMPESSVHIDLSSKLQLDVLQAEAGGYRVKFTLEPERWSYAIPGSTPERPEQIAGLFQLSRDGQIAEFRMNAQTYETFGFLIADILSLMEFTVPADESVQWAGVEHNFRGEIPVRFRLVDGDSRSMRLHKSYGDAGKLEVSGGTDFSVSATRLYESVKAQRERLTDDHRGTRMSDRTTLELKPSQGQLRHKAVAEESSMNVQETLDGTTYQKRVDEAIAIRTIGKNTVQDVKRTLERLDDKDPQKMAAAFVLLKAYLYLHPEAIAEFQSYLLTQSYDNQACRTVAAVLSELGSPEAQDALMKAIDGSTDDPERQEKLIAHLGVVEHLTEAAERRIYEIAESDAPPRIKGVAELAVGVAGGNHVLQGNKEGTERAVAFGADRLKAAGDNSAAQEQALRILGNIGAPGQVAVVRPLLNASKESTRRVAIASLRDVNTDEAQGILVDIMKNDSTLTMRHTAIESLSSKAQGEHIYDSLKAQLLVEKDDRMIRQIITHLVNMRRTYPEVRSLLETYLSQCGKSSVCGFAASALASM